MEIESMSVVQCAYCFHLKTSDGDYHDFGIEEKIVRIIASEDREKRLISHGICPECLERVRNAHFPAPVRENGLKAQKLPLATA